MAASRAMVAAGEHLSSSRPVRRVKTRPAARIPLCVEPPTPFAEGSGPGRDWWEKALSEKSLRAGKHENSQQNQGVGANSRTTTFGPFGEVIRATGPMAKVNPFRFSTKYQDDETDLLYYGKRYLRTSTGSWLSRDPMGERGGLNVYCFARNDGINFFDPDGRITVTTLTKNPTSDCGSAEVKWTFALDQPAPGDGYIVQKVTRSYDYQSCDGKTKVKTTQTFWEAWLVKKGQVNETGAALYGFTDNAGEPPRPQTHVTLTKAGEIKFFLASQTGNMGDPGVNPPVPPDPTTGFGGSNGNPSSGA